MGESAGRRNIYFALNVEGLFVVDGVVGDYLCQKYGDLKDTPLYIDIVDSRIKEHDLQKFCSA